MGQVYTPAEYRMHTGVLEMARDQLANRFGLAGLLGDQDPRSIPARGPTVVLPLVRGREGWFYLNDGGERAQTRIPGMQGLGDVTMAQLQQMQAQLEPTSMDWQIVQGLINQLTSNPGAASNPIFQGQVADVQATISQPGFQPYTPQEAATRVTGKPNQSVPPPDRSAVLPTGTGTSGGNPLLIQVAPAPSSTPWGLLAIGGVALYFLMKGK